MTPALFGAICAIATLLLIILYVEPEKDD